MTEKGNIASGTPMRARDIGTDGILRLSGVELPLLGTSIPVPPVFRDVKSQDTEKVLFIVEAPLYLTYCAKCKGPIKEDAILLVLETLRLLPAHCCDTLLWFDEDTYEQGDEEYGMETYE